MEIITITMCSITILGIVASWFLELKVIKPARESHFKRMEKMHRDVSLWTTQLEQKIGAYNKVNVEAKETLKNLNISVKKYERIINRNEED